MVSMSLSHTSSSLLSLSNQVPPPPYLAVCQPGPPVPALCHSCVYGSLRSQAPGSHLYAACLVHRPQAVIHSMQQPATCVANTSLSPTPVLFQ